MCSVFTAQISEEDNALLIEIASGGKLGHYGVAFLAVYEKMDGFVLAFDSDNISAARFDREEILADYGFSEAFIEHVRVSAKDGYMRMLCDEDDALPPEPSIFH